jgi:hypothetical protein
MEDPTGAVPATAFDRRQLLLSGVALTLAACSQEAPPPDKPPAPSAASPAASMPAGPTPRAADAPDLVAEAMLLPGLVQSSTEGPMIELLQAIASSYTGGKVSITAFPVGRVTADMDCGAADMALAYIRLRPDSDAKYKYRYSTKGYGQVTFVLYSRKSARVRPQDIQKASGQAGPFPYKIESAWFDWGFPVIQFTDMGSAFRKLAAGHIDAFLWAQEEADTELRHQGLKGITREAFGTYDDVLAIPRGPRGDYVDKVITEALTSLSASGRLQAIYRKIHLPYDPWQP